MTTNLTTAEDRLATLGLHLPDAPTPFGAYAPAVQTGNLLVLSGMRATSGHTATVVGIGGKDLDVKAGREAASEWLRAVVSDRTVSARLVCGVARLPRGSPVELEVIVAVKP